MSGNIFRKTYSIDVPADAERVVVSGVPSTRFKRGGKMVTAPLTADGHRARIQSPFWYGRVNGKEVKLFRDAVASRQRLAELVRKNERKESGVADSFEEHRAKPIVDHLNDYHRYLEAEGDCVEHVSRTVARIRAVMDGCQMTRIPDLTSEKVAEFLLGLRRHPVRPLLETGKGEFTPAELAAALGGAMPTRLSRIIARERLERGTGNGPRRRYPRATVERLQDLYCRGISIATSNGYLTAMKSFSKWLVQKERTDRDRLVSLSRLNADTDRRHERRALDEAELNRLLAVTIESTTTFEGLTGRERAMIYLAAMTTGLRASELASLSASSFDLLGEHPFVSVRAGYTKNRDKAEQPLPSDVATSFAAYLDGRPLTASAHNWIR